MRRKQKLVFSIPDQELDRLICEYKEKVETEEIPRASWANFCAFLGYTEQEVAEVVAKGNADSNPAGAYYKRAIALKRMMTWVRGQLSSGKGSVVKMTDKLREMGVTPKKLLPTDDC